MMMTISLMMVYTYEKSHEIILQGIGVCLSVAYDF